jgi:hypothetical protein
MGRTLSTALLFTMHLTFILCAALIVGPLVPTENSSSTQSVDKGTTGSPATLVQVSAGVSPDNRTRATQQEPLYQQKRLGQMPNQQPPFQWGEVEVQPVRDGDR